MIKEAQIIASRVRRGEFPRAIRMLERGLLHPQDRDYTPEGLGDPESDFVRRIYPSQALRSMFKDCDFVVVSVPLTDATRNLIETLVAMAEEPRKPARRRGNNP